MALSPKYKKSKQTIKKTIRENGKAHRGNNNEQTPNLIFLFYNDDTLAEAQ